MPERKMSPSSRRYLASRVKSRVIAIGPIACPYDTRAPDAAQISVVGGHDDAAGRDPTVPGRRVRGGARPLAGRDLPPGGGSSDPAPWHREGARPRGRERALAKGRQADVRPGRASRGPRRRLLGLARRGGLPARSADDALREGARWGRELDQEPVGVSRSATASPG